MRALTVRQPLAWAIIHGGKDVENRTRNVAGGYRGPVAIHAGLTAVGDESPIWDMPEYLSALDHAQARVRHRLDARGAFIGVVDLVDVHEAFPDAEDGTFQGPCCLSPWAQYDAGAHLMLANPRPLPVPIPARGMLGLWTPAPAVVEQLQAVTR